MNRFVRIALGVLCCGASVPQIARADVQLPALFSDNMVLQQGVAVPIWGKADPGEKVTVTFEGQTVSATADGGKWMVRLQPLKAGGPSDMTIAGKNTMTIKNVLVGEVWVGGGQSNMALTVKVTENGEEAVAQSANPQIRLFKVAQAASDTPLDDVKAKWEECGPDSVAGFSATAYFFGRALQGDLKVPVGLIESCVGGTSAVLWISPEAYKSAPDLQLFGKAAKTRTAQPARATKTAEKAPAKAKAEAPASQPARPRAKTAKTSSPAKAPRPAKPSAPSSLYNGMIKPLQPYAIKGAVWYQGEADSRDPERSLAYRKLFPAMIESWRKDWGQGDFPFLFVQLPGFGAPDRDWPALRESQLKTLSLCKNSGMAVAIDIGEEKNIHPKKKQPVGERLALAARAIAYGEKIEYSGPIYDSMKVEGDKAVVSFKHIGGGLEARGGELKGFAIASEDKKFVPATATIAPSTGSGQAGDTVVVSSPDVKAPAAVRYAWANWPQCNLFNKDGLPASPFRTDDWPLEEVAAPTKSAAAEP
ncbi:MAG: sialate O-acetylesterase [Candidatus Sumerlaeota bacterium]|nr:sialate O-acetylesterase [Candidatus Sumerlaeota bacterium]